MRYYLRKAGAFVYDDVLAERIALQAASEAASTVVDFTLVAPLLNASMKGIKEVRFNPALVLRPVREEELESWLNESAAFPFSKLPFPTF